MKTRFTHSPFGISPNGPDTTGIRTRTQRLFLLLAFFLAGTATTSAQQSNLGGCSLTAVPVTSSAFGSISVSATASGLGGWGTLSDQPGNAINASLTDRAAATVVVAGTATLRVTDAGNTYNAGNFVGFVVGTSGLNVSVLNNITLRTYLGGIQQEAASAPALLSLGVGTNQVLVGFYTDRTYDALEVEYTSLLNVLSTFDVYYPVMRGTGSCAVSTTPPCNAPVHPRFSDYRVVVDPLRTGVTGITTTTWANTDNLVDADTTNFTSLSAISINVLVNATLGVKRTVGNFDSGSFAGFDIENSNLLNLGVINALTINAYRGDTLVGTATGTSLLLGASLPGNSGRQTVGFVVTGGAFDEVELVMAQPANVTLGATNVYGAVIRRFCAGPAGPCNDPVALREQSQPVYINTQRTGFTGAACALCRIDSLGNLLDDDTLNRASIVMTGGAITTGSIAVRNAVTTYPGGSSYAGFELSNPNLLSVNVLNNTSVEVLRNGVSKQTVSGSSLLVSVPSSIISGTPVYEIGFVPDSAFDEVRLNLNQTVALSLGTTYVYRALLGNFCPGTIACNATNWLNAPAQSVFIDQRETGITGAACALCAVNNADSAISASTSDYAQLITTAGVLATSSLAVKDAVNTYPAGTIAGFAVGDPNSILELNLLRTIRITTFNNGVPQETATGGQLLNLSLLILQINPSSGYYNLGMRTTLPFDELKIGVTPLAGVAPVLNVYGAFVDTRFVDSISSTQACAKAPVADPDHIATLKNVTSTGSLRTNDHDPGNLSLTYAASPSVAPLHGTVTIGAGGSFSYVPSVGFTGLDSFQYTVCNTESLCSTAWAYVSVLDSRVANGPNTPQIVQPDRSETVMNVPVAGDAAANDIDVEQRPMNYAITTAPRHGTLTMTSGGQYLYTPDSAYVGLDSAYITVCDTATAQICRSAKLSLVVYPVLNDTNQAPYAADDVVATRRGLTVTGNVLNNDTDPDSDPLTVTPLDTVLAPTGILTMLPNGNWNFAPAAGFTGTLRYRYAISDGQGGHDTATLSITVVPYAGPDYTPTIAIASPNFAMVGVVRDFRVDITELLNGVNDGQVQFRIFKPSAFTVIHSDTITVVNAGGGVSAVSNSSWTFTETASSVICTLKPGITLPAFGIHSLGFRLQRKPNIPGNTTQNLTVGITTGSGGDLQILNNQYTVNVTAQ